MQTSNILSTPPVVRLGASQWAGPVLLISTGIISGLIFDAPLEWHALPEIFSMIMFLGGMRWMMASWQPGRGGPYDIVIPWCIVGILAACGFYLGANAAVSWQAVLPVFMIALPLVAGTTLLGRHYAPTDLCSASSSIGFTCSALACALAGLHSMPSNPADIMLAGAMALGVTMGSSRIVLCHILKW